MALDARDRPRTQEPRQAEAQMTSGLRRKQRLLSGRIGLGAVAALVAAVVMGLWLLWPEGGAETSGIVVAEVKRGDIEATVTAVGNLQPLTYVDVGAQVSGQIDDVNVEIGDTVDIGQLLVVIDPEVQQARVDAQKANLAAQRASLIQREAQRDLSRLQARREQRLHEEGATSDDALETAQTALAVAEAQVTALEAEIAQSESALKGEVTTLGYTRITAPMAGTVVSVDAKEGQTINATQQAPVILRIADLSTMTVWTQVSEADVARLKQGIPAYFTTLGEPERRYEGILRQILPTPETLNNVVLYTALFDVPNTNGTLRLNMTAQVFFVTASAKDVILVPAAAITRARGEGVPRGAKQVTVVRPGGAQEQRLVETGATDRVNVEIVSGLNEGERVIAGRSEGETSTTGSSRTGRSPLSGGLGGPPGRF